MAWLEQAFATCSACASLCEASCPAANSGRETLATPWAKMAIGRASLDGPLDAGVAAWLAWCSHCGACTVACRHEVPVGPALLEVIARADTDMALRVPADEVELLLERWRRRPPVAAQEVLLVGCRTCGSATDADELRQALARLGARDAEVVDDFDCGVRLLLAGQRGAFEAVGELVETAFAQARALVVTNGGCLQAFEAWLQRGRLRGSYAMLLDQWLARFGVGLPSRVWRLPCCRRRDDDAVSEFGAGSPAWPGSKPCCGAGWPLGRVEEAAAHRAGIDLLERIEAAGHEAVHVEDDQCRRHLVAVAA